MSAASLFRWRLNLYPPFLGAGVRVLRVSTDFREVDVAMGLYWFNRNYVGTQFGGSLYTMTDPFFMLMLMQCLGRDYIVWDQAAAIDFVSPGKGRVWARFRLAEEEIQRLRIEAESGAPLRPVYQVDVVDEAGTLVARVQKTLYVRKKKPRA
jgi:acyl-coenzyme A thioesterase PaaI-like protein